MLERLTVDILAGNVLNQLLEGEPTPKLAHRFFRKGRRDGTKAYDHGSVAKFLADAVQLAGSTLSEELTTLRRTANSRIAECEAVIEIHRATVAAGDVPASEPPTAHVAAASTSAHSAAPPGRSMPLLDNALEVRRAIQARKAADDFAAEARARHQARLGAMEAARSATTRAAAEISKINSDLLRLPDEYRQRFESIRHTGELLWSRYCNGFVQGERRRGSRASGVRTPAGTLELTTPAALLAGSGSPTEGGDN